MAAGPGVAGAVPVDDAGGEDREAPGRSRGGWSNKLHVLGDGAGRPLELIVTAGQRHECPRAIPLLEAGWEQLEPEAVLGDSGYSRVDLRAWIVAHGAEPVVPRKRHEHTQDNLDAERYRARNQVERLFNRLKRFRAVVTRMEKRVASYHAMVHHRLQPRMALAFAHTT